MLTGSTTLLLGAVVTTVARGTVAPPRWLAVLGVVALAAPVQ